MKKKFKMKDGELVAVALTDDEREEELERQERARAQRDARMNGWEQVPQRFNHHDLVYPGDRLTAPFIGWPIFVQQPQQQKRKPSVVESEFEVLLDDESQDKIH